MSNIIKSIVIKFGSGEKKSIRSSTKRDKAEEEHECPSRLI